MRVSRYNNFQTDNHKYSKSTSRTDIYNPEFNSSVNSIGEIQAKGFDANLHKWVDFVSWARWNPDLWVDLVTPEDSSIRLHFDQRVFLRALSRFVSAYAVFPRGYSKTLCEVLSMIHTAIFYPDIDLSMTAQTKENAVKILEEKYREIIRAFPIIKDEVVKASFAKDSAEILFHSGGSITVLANQQSSKGSRRKRLNVEESALLNNSLFQDVLEPIVNIPRPVLGLGRHNPEELNGQIHFLTTSGFRGSDEFSRNLQMIDEMADLKGRIVIGADWQLAVRFGRGETESQLLEKKAKLSPTFFAQNYMSRWVGVSDGALVDINKFLDLRTLTSAELESDGKSEYVLSMDVARSESKNNNQSSISVFKLKRAKDGRIIRVSLVNLINLKNGLNFTAQTAILKKTRIKYGNVRMVVADGNGLGRGLIDECLKDTIDPETGDSLGCWKTVNTDQEPELADAEEILYDLKAQGINSEMIVNFIDFVESKKLQLLEKRVDNNLKLHDVEFMDAEVLPFVQTDHLVEEVANLKLEHKSNGKFGVIQMTKRTDKDRYSSVCMGLFVIKTELDEYNPQTEHSATDYLLIN
jgi:ribonucleoside-diphosphate reductase alpha chain